MVSITNKLSNYFLVLCPSLKLLYGCIIKWVTFGPPPCHRKEPRARDLFGALSPIGSLFSVFWLHSREECLCVKFHKSLFWVPILDAGGPYWVPISQKVGSLFQSLGVPNSLLVGTVKLTDQLLSYVADQKWI